MKEDITKPMVIFCNNTSAINISKNPLMHTKTKHIAIKYHYLRELVLDKTVRMEYLNTNEQLTNIFTKAILKEPYDYLRSQLGVLLLSKAT